MVAGVSTIPMPVITEAALVRGVSRVLVPPVGYAAVSAIINRGRHGDYLHICGALWSCRMGFMRRDRDM